MVETRQGERTDLTSGHFVQKWGMYTYPKTQQTTDAWPYFTVCGPEVPCACGGCKFERLQDGAAWRCERCQVVVREGEVVAEVHCVT